MKVMEIVTAAQTANPQAFAGVDQSQAERIVRAVLKELGKRIGATEEGKIGVARFGNFVVRKSTKAAGEGDEKARRVIFKAAKRKAKGRKGKAGKGGKAGKESAKG